MATRSSASHRSSLSVLQGPGGRDVLDGLAQLSRVAARAAMKTSDGSGETRAIGGGDVINLDDIEDEDSGSEPSLEHPLSLQIDGSSSSSSSGASIVSAASDPNVRKRSGSGTLSRIGILAESTSLDLQEKSTTTSTRDVPLPTSSSLSSINSKVEDIDLESTRLNQPSLTSSTAQLMSPSTTFQQRFSQTANSASTNFQKSSGRFGIRFVAILSGLWVQLGRTAGGSDLQALLPLSVPVMLQSTLGQLLNIVDLFFVGNVLGPQFLAAAALGNMMFGLLSALYMGAASAVDSACAEAYEKGHTAHVGILAQRGIFVMLIAAVAVMGGITQTRHVLILGLGQARDLSVTASVFVSALTMGLVPHVLSIGLSRVLWAQGLVWAPILVDLISNVVNVSLNAMLIEVDGFLGAPLATSLSRALQLTLILFYLWRWQPHVINGTWRGWQLKAALGDLSGLASMAKAAFFGAVECAAESWPLELTNAVAGLINVPSIDAHTVVLNSCLFISLGLPLGMSVSSSARIPQLLEAGDAIGAQRTAIVAGVTTFVYNAICALLLIASRWNMGHIFTKDQEVTDYCASVAGMAAIFSIFDGMQTVLAGILRGLGHRRIVTLLNFGGMGLLGLPLAFFFAIQAGYGLIGIWLGLVIGVVSLTISYAAMLSTVDWTRTVGAWQRQAIVDRELDALSSPSPLPPPQTPPVMSKKDLDVSVNEGGSPSELERRSPSILDERERMIKK